MYQSSSVRFSDFIKINVSFRKAASLFNRNASPNDPINALKE